MKVPMPTSIYPTAKWVLSLSGYYIITIAPDQKLFTFTLSGIANVCVAFFVVCQQETHAHRNRHLTCYMPHKAGRKYLIQFTAWYLKDKSKVRGDF